MFKHVCESRINGNGNVTASFVQKKKSFKIFWFKKFFCVYMRNLETPRPPWPPLYAIVSFRLDLSPPPLCVRTMWMTPRAFQIQIPSSVACHYMKQILMVCPNKIWVQHWQHTKILNITEIMQTVMNKISFTDIQIQCSGEAINNQRIAPRELKVTFNLELSFICSGYSIYFMFF